MDRIINWFLLVIIFVFDPLAIALVIAANFAFAKLKKTNEIPIEEKIEDMRKVVDAYDDLQDEINIPEKDWIEDWPDDNDEELETASLEDFQTWEDEEKEPYQIYTTGSNDWVIEDEEKAYDNLMQSLDKINDINNENMDFFNKKSKIDAEIERIKAYEKSLQEKRKNKKDDDNVKTY